MIKKFLVAMTIVILGVGAVWGWIMFRYIPEWWFPLYPLLPAFFYLMGMVQVAIVWRADKSKKKNSALNSALLQRVIRWFVLILVLVLLLVLADPPKVSFLISFMGLYMIFSMLEVFLLHHVAKNAKTRAQ